MRFLAAVCSLGHGTYLLDGTARMRQRPIGDLLAALRDLGVKAEAGSPGECPPVTIHTQGLTGGTATIRGTTSSQFASGLALVAPCTTDGMRIEFVGALVSLPYLAMTRRVMADFGAGCDVLDDRTWQIVPGGYTSRDYEIEPDASGASYFFAAAAITGARSGSTGSRGEACRATWNSATCSNGWAAPSTGTRATGTAVVARSPCRAAPPAASTST
jgi:3-phosphoshikimate 1-carboxyvinyltransferase